MKRKYLPALLLVLGMGLMLFSLAVPPIARHWEPWTDEDARAYQQASARLHALGHGPEDHPGAENGHHAHGAQASHDAVERAEARAEFERMKKELEAAQEAGGTAVLVCRVLGLMLVVGGLGWLAATGNHEAKK